MKNKKLFAILTLVCFLMTLMPVAAFAETVDVELDPAFAVADSLSSFVVKDQEVTVGDKVAVEVEFVSQKGEPLPSGIPEVWASEKGQYSKTDANYTVTKDAEADNTYNVVFDVAGEYDIHVASKYDPANSEAKEFKSDNRTVKVNAKDAEEKTDVKLAVDSVVKAPKANNITVEDSTLHFVYGKEAKDLRKEAVSFKSNNQNLVVKAQSAKTNYSGVVKVDLTATRAGSYTITATIAGADVKIPVVVEGTDAVKIATKAQPEKLIATTKNFTNDNHVEFEFRDINNNVVEQGDTYVTVDTLTAPKKSTLEAGNFKVVDGILVADKAFDEEGDYSVKVVMENGSVATAAWTVKKAGKAVKMVIDTQKTVEPKKTFTFTFKYYDANEIEVEAVDSVEYYVTGKAVASVTGKTVTVRDGEKYLGQEIVVNAHNTDNDLTATTTVKVVEERVSEVVFDDVTLETFAPNTVGWKIVDADGNDVTFGTEEKAVEAKVFYNILSKPEGAYVPAIAAEPEHQFKGTGDGEFVISCDKPGNVTVQVVVFVDNQYYTATKVFAVGGANVGDVVVMTIGTQTLVKNGEVTTMDATPIIKDNRTFVPFRALAEAFGAEVAYDETAKTVTATLDGTSVVMTIGSADYTVNGAAQKMDVAPYIDGERTMVPVRFVAEAFGIDVTAVPDVTDGTTASVIFNK